MTTTMMRLSHAIRLGAAMRPQGFNGMFRAVAGRKSHAEIASCALGAAAEALAYGPGVHSAGHTYDLLRERFPMLAAKIERCEMCGQSSSSMMYRIIHLNDEHLWPREKIADWVELQEPMPSEEPAEPAAAAVTNDVCGALQHA